MGFKIFGFHARDFYDRGQPQGTCVLLEVLSPDSLVYITIIYLKWEEYKLRTVKIG